MLLRAAPAPDGRGGLASCRFSSSVGTVAVGMVAGEGKVTPAGSLVRTGYIMPRIMLCGYIIGPEVLGSPAADAGSSAPGVLPSLLPSSGDAERDLDLDRAREPPPLLCDVFVELDTDTILSRTKFLDAETRYHGI